MHNWGKSKIGIAALGLLLVFVAVFYLSIRELRQVAHQPEKDIKVAALAMRKIRKKVKSEIKSPDDPEARFMYELRRLRSPITGKIPENIRQKELAFSATIPTSELVKFSKLGPGARGMVLNWDHRGPFNVGGRTRALAMDIANPGTILAGGVSGGMWRSTNSGQSWVKTTDPTLLQSVTTVSQDKRASKTNTWYYGSGELEGNSASTPGALYRGNGIYKSTNGGVSWAPLPFTTTANPTTFNNVFQWVWRVATNPANAAQDEVLAATIGGLQRSVDGGATWVNALGSINATAANNFSRYSDIAISSTGVMYATMSQSTSGGTSSTSSIRGIFRSVNGQDWTNITPADFPTRFDRIVLDISPSNENIVYFLASTPNAGKFNASFYKYTYVSGTGAGTGGTWENRSANIPGFGGSVGDLNLQGNYNMLVKVKPDNPQVVFMGGTNLYRSTDGFATTANTKWIGGYSTKNNISQYDNHHPDQHALIFYPNNSERAISAHDGGVSESSNLTTADPVTWTSLNRGYLTTQFTAVAIDMNTTSNLIMGGMQDNGTWYVQSTASNAAWDDLLSGDGAFGAAVGNSLFASAQNGFIYRFGFTSTGAFRGFSRIDPKGGGGYLFVNPYVLDPNNENVMYLPAGDSLWRNSNIDAIPLCNPSPAGGGTVDCSGSQVQPSTNWKVISTLGTTQEISAVVISKTPANIVYFGTSNGRVYRLDNSLSDTPTRTDITGSNFPAAGAATPYVSSIAVDPNNANNVTVTFSNYEVVSVYQSTNGGTSWTPIAGNLEENTNGTGNGPSVRWINILPSRTGGATKYFVGTSTGVFATSNINGMNTVWIKEGSTTIGNVPVDMIVSRPTDNLVVIGTHGNGVYSHFYNEALAVSDAVIPETFTVKQNYPNPFIVGSGTTISYSLAKPGRVIIRVYDLAGREVDRLVDAEQTVGEHSVFWSGRNQSGGNFANGMYLYRVQFEKEQITKQMVLRR